MSRVRPSDERWLVTGASGLLGWALCERLIGVGHTVIGVHLKHPVPGGVIAENVDLAETGELGEIVHRAQATTVVHAAALTDVDACEHRQDAARSLHVDATRSLASAAESRGARFIMISTDQLWGDASGRASEARSPKPVNVYGRTKASGEKQALSRCQQALVIRTNFFGRSPTRGDSYADAIIKTVASGAAYYGFADVWFTPIGLPLLVNHILELASRDARGVVHVGGAERVSKLDFARRLVAHVGLQKESVREGCIADLRLPAPRPREMSLDCRHAERLLTHRMPTLDASFEATIPAGASQAQQLHERLP